MVRRLGPIALLAVVLSLAFWIGRRLGETGGGVRTIDLPGLLAANGRSVISGSGDSSMDSDSAATPDEVFATVLDHVQREYVEPIDDTSRLNNGALTRMFASLDDVNTRYLDPSERQERQKELNGRFSGIGAALSVVTVKQDGVEYNYLTVVDSMPGSPAEAAGLRSGDRITEINGRWIINYSPRVDIMRLPSTGSDDALNAEYDRINEKFKRGLTVARTLPLLTQGVGKDYELTVDRPGAANPFRVRITTAVTVVAPTEFRMLGNGVGYLRVRQFNPGAADGIADAVARLGSSARGLVVDLRGNPGGVQADASIGVDGFATAVELAAHFTHGGPVAILEHRRDHRDPLVVKASIPALRIPLAVLVDHGTANLAEFAACALRDAGKARIIGGATFGNSVLHKLAVFRGGGAVEFSHLKLLTAGGAQLDAGIKPDIAVSGSGRGGVDAALQVALATMHSKV